MTLATSFLPLEQIQLLADCIEPAIVLEIPAAAGALIERGLLVSSELTCDDRSCYVLVVSERGRAYVTAWLERQEQAQRRSRLNSGIPFGRAAIGPLS